MSTDLSKILSVADYQSTRGHLFPSHESLKWYIRKNRVALADAGALLEIAGRLMVLTDAFDQMVLDLGKNAARGVAA